MPFDQGQPIAVSVVNYSTIPTDKWLPAGKTLEDVASMLDKYIGLVSQAWGGSGMKHTVETEVKPGSWGLGFYDKSDVQGALGFHELTPEFLPMGKVFVQDTLDAGEDVVVDATHEDGEWYADPGCNMCYQDQRGWFWFGEIADAVEETFFELDGFKVSNFVYPSFFETFRKPDSDKFDYLGKVTSPLQILEGGYLSVNRRGRWQQVYGSQQSFYRHSQRMTNRRSIIENRLGIKLV